MNPASINSIVGVESMTGIALIVVAVLVKVIRNLLKRLSKSRLILETDSLTLNWQTQQHSLQQEKEELELLQRIAELQAQLNSQNNDPPPKRNATTESEDAVEAKQNLTDVVPQQNSTDIVEEKTNSSLNNTAAEVVATQQNNTPPTTNG